MNNDWGLINLIMMVRSLFGCFEKKRNDDATTKRVTDQTNQTIRDDNLTRPIERVIRKAVLNEKSVTNLQEVIAKSRSDADEYKASNPCTSF